MRPRRKEKRRKKENKRGPTLETIGVATSTSSIKPSSVRRPRQRWLAPKTNWKWGPLDQSGKWLTYSTWDGEIKNSVSKIGSTFGALFFCQWQDQRRVQRVGRSEQGVRVFESGRLPNALIGRRPIRPVRFLLTATPPRSDTICQ